MLTQDAITSETKLREVLENETLDNGQIHYEATKMGGTGNPDSSVRLSDKPITLALLKSTAALQAELTKQGKPRKAGRFGGVAA